MSTTNGTGGGTGGAVGNAGGAPAGGAANGAVGGGGTPPASPSLPPGMRLVSEQDWTSRDSFFSKAQELGFKDADTLGKYAPLHKTLGERGMDPSHLTNLLSPKPADNKPSDEPKYMTREEAEQFYSEREARTKAELDWESHQKSAPAKIEAKVGDYLKGIGLKPDSKFSRFLKSAIADDIREARIAAREAAEWKGSPLSSERLPPITDSLIEQVMQTRKYQEILTEMRGEFLAAIGDGSGAPVRPTANAAGKGESNQPPKAKAALDDDDEEFDNNALKIVREVAARG